MSTLNKKDIPCRKILQFIRKKAIAMILILAVVYDPSRRRAYFVILAIKLVTISARMLSQLVSQSINFREVIITSFQL